MNNSSNKSVRSLEDTTEDEDFFSIMNDTFWSPLWIRDESRRLERRNYATEFYYSFFKNRRVHKPITSNDFTNHQEGDSINNEDYDNIVVSSKNHFQCSSMIDFVLNQSRSKNNFSSSNHEIKNSTINNCFTQANLENQRINNDLNFTLDDSVNPAHLEGQVEEMFNSTINNSSNTNFFDADDFNYIINNISEANLENQRINNDLNFTLDDPVNPAHLEEQVEEMFNPTTNNSSNTNIFDADDLNSIMINFTQANLENQRINNDLNFTLDDSVSPAHLDGQVEEMFNSTINNSSNTNIFDADDLNSIMNNTFWSPLWRRDDSRRLQRMHYATDLYYNLIKRRTTRNFGFNNTDENSHNTTDNDANNSSCNESILLRDDRLENINNTQSDVYFVSQDY